MSGDLAKRQWLLVAVALAACATAPISGEEAAAEAVPAEKANDETATVEEIHKYAGQLIYEFELFGPVMRFRSPPPPLPPGY